MRQLIAPLGAFARTGLHNLILRCLTLASKLAFIVYAGRELAVEDMAVYGLMATTVGLAVTLLGAEFYAFSTREILGRPESERPALLRDQLVFYGVAYVLLIPLSLPVFVSGVLDWSLAGWFFALAIAEHLAQELARLYNTLFRPVFSSVLFFVRSAAWGLGVIAVSVWNPAWATVPVILGFWTAGVVISVVWGFADLRRLDWSSARQAAIDWPWIRRGVAVAVPFFVSALSYRVIELADRYLIHFMLDDTAVGVYSFYATLANVIPAVIGAALSAILVPRIVQAYQNGDLVAYHRHFRTLNLGTCAVIAIAVPAVFAGIVGLQSFLARPEYARELPTCLVLLLSTSMSVIAQLPGVGLYARGDDWALLWAVVIGAVSNTLLNLVLIPAWGILGAAWSTTASYAAMGGYQLYRLRRASLAVSAAQ